MGIGCFVLVLLVACGNTRGPGDTRFHATAGDSLARLHGHPHDVLPPDFFREEAEIPGFAGKYISLHCPNVVLATHRSPGIDSLLHVYDRRILPEAPCSRTPVVPARYSWAQLSSWLRQLQTAPLAGVIDSGISVSMNRIALRLDAEAAVAGLNGQIALQGVPYEAVRIAVEPLPQELYTITMYVRVYDEHAGYVGGALVQVYPEAAPPYEGFTDETGVSFITSLPRRDEYLVRVIPPEGYDAAPGEVLERVVRESSLGFQDEFRLRSVAPR